MSKRKQANDKICILHIESLADPRNFTPFSKVKQETATEKLQRLLDVRNQCLNEAYNSPHRMQSICDQIPTCLPEDLDSFGYHRQCYQRFISNLDRLAIKDPCGSSLQQQQSRCSRIRTVDFGPLFPSECIFCEKN